MQAGYDQMMTPARRTGAHGRTQRMSACRPIDSSSVNECRRISLLAALRVTTAIE
jgi:hypothetical protein